MKDRKTLVVYFSRSGETRSVAEAIAHELACDVEELQDKVERRGVFGYLRSGFEALFQRRTELRELKHDPADYEMVIVGTPIWNASLSSPVRTYLEQHRHRIPRAAFFVTCGSAGSHRVFRQMETAGGVKPVAELALRDGEIDRNKYSEKLRSFIDEVTGRKPVQQRAKGLRRFLQTRVTV